ATQRPSVDVVTGLIKANFPTRVAFQVASKVDSRTVLDGNGAEQLLGRGDMIFVPPAANKHMRVHGAWVADEEVRAICDFLRKQGTAVYEEVVLPAEGETTEAESAERDDLYWDAVHLVIAQRQASISFLQRRMRLGYPKAARFVDMMDQDRSSPPGHGATRRRAREVTRARPRRLFRALVVLAALAARPAVAQEEKGVLRPCTTAELVGTWEVIRFGTAPSARVDRSDPYFYPHQRYVFSADATM